MYILVRGMPGSGKTTFVKKTFGDRLWNFIDHFEADQYFTDIDGNYRFDASRLKDAHQLCLDNTEWSLSKGREVVVSNTFTTIKELKPYFELGKMYNATPVVILCQNKFTSVHNVPEEALERMKNRFEYNLTPLWDYFYE